MSGFSSSTNRPRARASARLLARAKPSFEVFARRVTSGNSAATMSGVPSFEELSTTTISVGTLCVAARRVRRQSLSRSRVLNDATTTESSGSVRGGLSTGAFIGSTQASPGDRLPDAGDGLAEGGHDRRLGQEQPQEEQELERA